MPLNTAAEITKISYYKTVVFSRSVSIPRFGNVQTHVSYCTPAICRDRDRLVVVCCTNLGTVATLLKRSSIVIFWSLGSKLGGSTRAENAAAQLGMKTNVALDIISALNFIRKKSPIVWFERQAKLSSLIVQCWRDRGMCPWELNTVCLLFTVL